MTDLFSVAVEDRLRRRAPLAARLRPRSLDEVVGQEDLLGPGRPLRTLIEADRLSSLVLWGPPGTGKTTIARLVAGATAKAFEPLSAVTAGVKDVREVAERARARLGEQGQGTILFLDEVHRFNRTQQDALLPHVEEGLLVLVGATTENPFFSLTGPLLSRSTLFRLEPLGPDAVRTLIERGLVEEASSADEDAVAHLVAQVGGDGRQVLTALEVAVALADTGAGPPHVELAHVEAALNAKALRYGEDEHYDVISAFIKSIRGSDPDAALYWLALMIESGEDARFIARRLVISASEDIGLADSMGLVVANAAAQAVEFVGFPEARLALAHATVYLATAAKSNRSYAAFGKALADVQDQPRGEVPLHLRGTGYRGAASLGHGEGYEYPHDDPRGWVDQEYRPPGLAGRRYYEPSTHGAERRVAERMAERTARPTEEEPDERRSRSAGRTGPPADEPSGEEA